jgi:hypothetical protein
MESNRTLYHQGVAIASGVGCEAVRFIIEGGHFDEFLEFFAKDDTPEALEAREAVDLEFLKQVHDALAEIARRHFNSADAAHFIDFLRAIS